jgi:hypothetical protein
MVHLWRGVRILIRGGSAPFRAAEHIDDLCSSGNLIRLI